MVSSAFRAVVFVSAVLLPVNPDIDNISIHNRAEGVVESKRIRVAWTTSQCQRGFC